MESAEWQRLSQFVSDTRESLVRAAPPIPGSPSLEQTTDEILSTLSDLTLGVAISWTVGAVREVACRLATTMHLPVDPNASTDLTSARRPPGRHGRVQGFHTKPALRASPAR
jgi:hypothetical protein